MVKAVTFDFWNTVMWEEGGSLRARRLERWTEQLATRRVAVDGTALAEAHDAAHAAYEDAWRANTQYRVEDAAAQIIAALQPHDAHEVEGILLEGYDEAGRRAAVQPVPGIRECLEDLRAREVKLGIVCDIGLTPSPVVRELLAREGLLELFDHTGFSDEVGFYKPAPEFFRYELTQLGDPDPSDAAHIGDRLRTDVGGARDAGMISARYRHVYDDPADLPEADLVIDDMAEFPAALEALVAAR